MDFAIHRIVEVDPASLAKTQIKDDSRVVKFFLIVDASFSDAGRAMTVMAGGRVPGSDTIADLDAKSEAYMIMCMADHMKEVPDGERYTLVFDLTSFPYLSAMIDRREPERGDDQFTRDVYEAWSTYDHAKEIPVIVVNAEVPRTGLKILPLPWV